MKETRNQDLLATVNGYVKAQYATLVGSRQQVLCEGPSKTDEDRLTGRTRENRIVVFEGNPERHIGEIFDVQITEHQNFTLFGDVVLR